MKIRWNAPKSSISPFLSQLKSFVERPTLFAGPHNGTADPYICTSVRKTVIALRFPIWFRSSKPRNLVQIVRWEPLVLGSFCRWCATRYMYNTDSRPWSSGENKVPILATCQTHKDSGMQSPFLVRNVELNISQIVNKSRKTKLFSFPHGNVFRFR